MVVQWLACLPGMQKIHVLSPGFGSTNFCALIHLFIYIYIYRRYLINFCKIENISIIWVNDVL